LHDISAIAFSFSEQSAHQTPRGVFPPRPSTCYIKRIVGALTGIISCGVAAGAADRRCHGLRYRPAIFPAASRFISEAIGVVGTFLLENKVSVFRRRDRQQYDRSPRKTRAENCVSSMPGIFGFAK
jgi:hypothetical protein